MLKLRLLTGPRAGRQLRVSDTKPVSIGRRKGRLRLHDSRVSKRHAEIYFDNDLWLLRDLGSANGTYVNRKRAEGLVELEPGDMVQMGRVLIKIVRCDGIGMDMPGVSDSLLDEAADLGLGVGAGAVADDDDFDLDDLLGDDSDEIESLPTAGLDALPTIDEDEPEAKPAEASGEVSPVQDEFAEETPEPIAVAFDEPVDDDDSFFADLGEATDQSDGIDVAVQDELAQDELAEDDADDEVDPFLGDAEDQADEDETSDTSDQITLEDESGMGPHSAGTTLLTSVPHDDLIDDDDDASSGSFFGDVGSASETEDVDDEAPAVVGLHLDHAPPQQPQPTPQSTEQEHEVEAEAEVEPDEVDEVDEPDEPVAQDEEPTPVDDDEPAEVVVEAEPESQEEELVSAGVQDEPEVELEPEIDLTAEIESEFADDFEDDSAGDFEDDFTVDPEPDADTTPQPAAQTPALDADDDGPEFDIDAAFDALSAGLDDSQEAPALDAEPDDAPSKPLSESPGQADPLVGSQLDVGYIQDALSKLEQDQAPDAEPPTEETQPKASTAPTTPPPTMPPAASPPDSYIQSPPPGLNPMSVNPPAEPRHTYRSSSDGSGKGRWFLSILLLLAVGGAGGWLISQNYDKLIAGRDTGPISNSDNTSPTITPNNPAAQPDQPAITPTNPPAPTLPDAIIADDEQDQPTQPAGPDPFAAGPVVIGPDALDGLTSGADPNRPLDAPQQPSTNNPTTPGTIVQPNVGPSTTNPSIDTPDPILPGTDQPTPTIDAPPARIVFLVDASGSLVDSLPQMVVWLNEALQTIKADERFAVYFFKSGDPIAVKPDGMLTPTRDVLNQLRVNWLNPDAVPVFPSGRSNPTKAIAQALTHNPTDLYLLSDDAFAMHQGGTTPEESLKLVTQALGNSDVRVHGVQFFYRGDDSILETLANQTKGTFEFVRERVIPDAEPIDLLEELEDE